MEFFKAKYDRVILLAAAALLLASSAFLFFEVQHFKDAFSQFLQPFSPSAKIKPLPLDPIKAAQTALEQAPKWGHYNGSLFVSKKYVLKPNDTIQLFDAGGEPYHPPVPNIWFFENHLDGEILQADVLDQDPDNDKFTNFEEWKGKTDPQDPKKHPPYTDKLRLKKFIQVPFRIVFEARDGETFQINTIDLKRPSQFLKTGDMITGTPFKIQNFEEKFVTNKLGIPEDTSELTIKSQITGEEMVLPIRKIVNSPDVYAEFAYLWDGSEFTKKKDQDFQLSPDDKTTYKLIDINQSEALIKNLGTGAEIQVPKL
ncbi:MAG TPA: Amuc_1099 family pilus-like system protein [Chthoniobacterales bacterium]